MPIATMHDLYAINRRGERCEPHRYKDGRFRAVRYRSGDKAWKHKRNYIVFPECELKMMATDPELSIRMSPTKDRKRPALFTTRHILKI